MGATGLLGFEVCKRLRAAEKPVRAVVRPSSLRIADVRALGVEIFEGDIRAAGVVAAACKGVTTVISTATAMASPKSSLRDVDRDGQLLLVDQAKRAGVRHFIFVSASPNHSERSPLMRYKRAVERAVRASGMQWTILQPSCFMEIWLSNLIGWDFDQGKAMVFGAGTEPVTWVSISDVAAYCVKAVDDQRMWNRDIPFGGATMPPNEVVSLAERVTGRKFKVTRVPAIVPRLLAPVIALFDEKQASKMALGAQVAKGDVVTCDLQKTLALEMTSLEEYLRRVARS